MNLDELQRLAEGATPGPWFADQYGLGVYVGDYAVASLMTKSGAHRNHEDNAKYIAAMSPDTAKKLIAAARAALALLPILEEHLFERGPEEEALRSALGELKHG